MALDASHSEKFSEMERVVGLAESQFAGNLLDSARSVLLNRITGSSDKRAELSYFLGILKKMGDLPRWTAAVAELEAILSEGTDKKSVGQLYSSMTSVLDDMNPKELYSVMDELRKEPLHTAISVESE